MVLFSCFISYDVQCVTFNLVHTYKPSGMSCSNLFLSLIVQLEPVLVGGGDVFLRDSQGLCRRRECAREHLVQPRVDARITEQLSALHAFDPLVLIFNGPSLKSFFMFSIYCIFDVDFGILYNMCGL